MPSSRTPASGAFQTRRRYISWNPDHKVIGIQYLVTTFTLFLIGGALAMVMSTELNQPGVDLLNGAEYNRFMTHYGSVPLSIQSADGQSLWAVSVILLGTSSIMGAINFVTTVVTMRALGITLWRLPLFVWAMLATALLVITATPVLTAGLVLVALDRLAGTLFFS